MRTQGILLVQQGSPEAAFKLADIEINVPREDEVLIEVESFGLNYADVMARLGLYRETPPLPCVIGYEVIGKVCQVGHESHADLLGKRVVAITHFGGYAKHAITKIKALIVINDIPASEAMALATQGVTAYYMANYASPIRKGENVLIHAAAGGVGSLLIQLAKLAGANVFAKVSSNEKGKKCLDLGADYFVNYKTTDYVTFINSKIGEKQLDVSFNPVGGSTYKQDKQLLGAGSRIFIFGGSELSNGKWGKLSQINFLKKMGIELPIFAMMQSKGTIGVNMLRIALHRPEILVVCLSEVLHLYKTEQIKIQVGGVFSIDQLNEAHKLLESGNSIGKISVQW